MTNAGGHSSQPRADNAIYELADALKAVQAYEFPVMWNDWTIGGFKAAAAQVPGELGAAMAQFAAHPGDAAAAELISKSPTFVGRVRTTCVATMLQGGHADNALPQSAVATINCRIFPGTSAEDVAATLQRLVGAKAKVTTIGAALLGPAVADARRCDGRGWQSRACTLSQPADRARPGALRHGWFRFSQCGDPDLRCHEYVHQAFR